MTRVDEVTEAILGPTKWRLMSGGREWETMCEYTRAVIEALATRRGDVRVLGPVCSYESY